MNGIIFVVTWNAWCEKNFCFLFVSIFERMKQVTEMLECKVNLTV